MKKKRLPIGKIIGTIIKVALIVYLSIQLKDGLEPMLNESNYQTKKAKIENVQTELVDDDFSGKTYNIDVIFNDGTKIETKNQGANTANAFKKSIGQEATTHFYKNEIEYATINYEEVGIEGKEYSIDSIKCNEIKTQDFSRLFILFLAILILIGLL